MSQIAFMFDPSVALSGDLNTSLGFQCTRLKIANDSKYTLKLVFGGQEEILHAWTIDVFDVRVGNELSWSILTTLASTSPPNSTVYGIAYSKSDKIDGVYPMNLSRTANIGNTVATSTPLQPLDIDVTDALTNTQLTILQSEHRSSGTPTTGFGSGWYMYAEDDAHLLEFMFRIRAFWLVATSGVQTARATIDIGDSGTLREIIRLESTGAAGAIGFLGHAAAVKPAALVQTYATSTRTLTAYTANNQSAAYTGQDNAQAGTVYAKVADLNTLRVAYENLRTQFETLMQFVNAFVDDMQAYGLE